MAILKKYFFERSALAVAKNLLGKFLVRRIGPSSRKSTKGKQVAVMITETEAYIGPQDLASHASRGRTPRTEVMFGEAGRWYVYFTYGMHWMLNVVTGPKNYPAAVLLRAGKRQIARSKWIDLNGPARLTKYLKIDKRLNAKPARKKTGLWIEDRGVKTKPSEIKRGPRVGVYYAGKWARRPYNFRIKI